MYRFLKKTENRSTIGRRYPTSGNIAKECEIRTWKTQCTLMLPAPQLTAGPARCALMTTHSNVTCDTTEQYSGIKNEWNLNMYNLQQDIIMLSKMRPIQKDKCHVFSFLRKFTEYKTMWLSCYLACSYKWFTESHHILHHILFHFTVTAMPAFWY